MQRISNSVWVERATAKHNGQFSYPVEDWPDRILCHTKVPVICNLCETTLLVEMNSHVNSGNGCRRCSGKYQWTTSERIAQAHKVHGDKYDYSSWPISVSSKTRLTTFCKMCEESWQHTVNNHVNHKSGCPKCTSNYQPTLTERIKQARKLHGSKYDYSLWPEDLTAKAKVLTICNCCSNDWEHDLDKHINVGQGCPVCSGKNQDVFYINDVAGIALKFGITNNYEQRIATHNRLNPLKMKCLKLFRFTSARDCKECEASIKKVSVPVLSKVDLPEGFTETIAYSKIDWLVARVEQCGGILTASPI